MIDVRQLTYYVAVVEAKSFTAASEVLHVAQPALSQHIQRLEYEFGQQLLVRHSRGIVPTPAGLRLVEHAREILSAIDNAKDDIRHFSHEPDQKIRVGMPGSLTEAFAIDLLESWGEIHPKVHLQFVEQPSESLHDLVQTGKLDIAVTSYPADSSKLDVEPLVQDKLCAILPPTSEGSKALGEINFAELTKMRLIVPSFENVGRQLLEMTSKYALAELDIAYVIDAPRLAVKLVQAGHGVTIQPFLAARRLIGSVDVDVRMIVSPSITRRLHIICPAQRTMPVYLSTFKTMIRERMYKLADQYPGSVKLDELSEVS